MSAPQPARARTWLSRNVLGLGLVSLLTDAATELVIPLLPVFLTTTLGAGALALGWIEGTADAVASVLKLLSGRWADRSGRYRPFVLTGYGLSSLFRPFVALATVAWHVLAVRVLDRVGKGLRGSPRDVLLVASVAPDERGRAFGLHRAMDHAGAVLGPLLGFALLTWVTTDLRVIFWLSAIPGALAVLTILLVVREPAAPPRPAPAAAPPRLDASDARALARLFVPLTVFTLGNASDVFLLLAASASRSPLESLPLLWMGLHVVKALASIPGGRLADRWGRRRTLAAGWVVYAAVYAGFAVAESREAVWALFVVYGLYHGLTESSVKALVVDLAPARARGTALGWYHLLTGLGSLAASVLFGALWELVSPAAAFATGASLAILAVLLLGLLRPRPPISSPRP
ncbi:MAG: MFS transporter [Deltaproteobacteria bacterium]|nr:MAG: MFS transporter [Deltaproteobacteria bacterium]